MPTFKASLIFHFPKTAAFGISQWSLSPHLAWPDWYRPKVRGQVLSPRCYSLLIQVRTLRKMRENIKMNNYSLRNAKGDRISQCAGMYKCCIKTLQTKVSQNWTSIRFTCLLFRITISAWRLVSWMGFFIIFFFFYKILGLITKINYMNTHYIPLHALFTDVVIIQHYMCIQGCWQVLSPTRKETSYSDRRCQFHISYL
jgi:hypothetical protein